MPAEQPAEQLSDLWRRVSEELSRSLPASTFDLWLAPLRPLSISGETIFLAAPPTVRTWVERRYRPAIEAALRSQAPGLSLCCLVDSEAASDAPEAPRSLPLDSAHVFDRFVIGPCNRLAHAAALAVAELPGEAYNPLFLHGSPGLGKTHLLGAIVEYMRRNHPALQVHYTTAERFTSEFVGALRRDGPERFKARYRDLDALLIDDVQVLEGKQRTEEEFVHTFNALHQAGKQIVLSSDRPPEALTMLAERLRDRFLWGLRVELEPPDQRTRVALLWRLAAGAEPDAVEPAVLHEIAARAPENVRGLEGAMTRVLAVASLLEQPLSMPLVERALAPPDARDSLPARPPTPTLEAIQEAVCATVGLERRELLSKRRAARVAGARQLAMYLARELTSLSLAEIARAFERDHSTVIHAVRSVASRIEPGSETAHTIHQVRAALGRTAAPATLISTDDDHHPPPRRA